LREVVEADEEGPVTLILAIDLDVLVERLNTAIRILAIGEKLQIVVGDRIATFIVATDDELRCMRPRASAVFSQAAKDFASSTSNALRTRSTSSPLGSVRMVPWLSPSIRCTGMSAFFQSSMRQRLTFFFAPPGFNIDCSLVRSSTIRRTLKPVPA